MTPIAPALAGRFFTTEPSGKVSACQAGDTGSILSWEDPLEKEMATHSNILIWEIPWTEKPGVLQSMGLQIVGNNLMTKQQKQILTKTNGHTT